jgi:hypothetical protein
MGMMQTFFTPVNIVLTICAIQGGILAVILMTKKSGNTTANRILALMVAQLSFSMIFHALAHKDLLPLPLDAHIQIIAALFIVFGPAIYFYVLALTEIEFKFEQKDITHTIPFFFCLLMAIFSAATSPADAVSEKITFINICVAFLSFVAYLYPAYNKLIQYSKIIKENFSDLEQINLRWLRFLIALLTIFWIVTAFLELILTLENWDIIWLISSIIIYIISYLGLFQPAIFEGVIHEPINQQAGSGKKYKKSALDNDMADQYLQSLHSKMMTERLYLQNDLSLSRLSDYLNIPVHHLSQVINENLPAILGELL